MNSFMIIQIVHLGSCMCELENKKMETRLLGQVSAVDIQILARILQQSLHDMKPSPGL